MFLRRHAEKFSFLKKVFLSFSLALMILFVYFYLTEQKPEILEKFNFVTVKDFLNSGQTNKNEKVNVNSLLNQISSRRPVEEEGANEVQEEDLKEVLNKLITKVDRVEESLNKITTDPNLPEGQITEQSKNLNPDLDLTRFPNSPLFNATIFSDKVGLVFQIATQDDGLLEILDILKDWQIEATFLISPKYMTESKTEINQILIGNHEIGFLYDDYSVFKNNIIQDKQFLEQKWGLANIYLVGFLNNSDINFSEIDEMGFRAVLGNLDSEDDRNIDSVILKKLEATKVGDIVIFSVSYNNGQTVLPNYLKILQSKKLSGINLGKLF